MIVNYMDKPKGGNRNQAPGLIKYIFGATKENSKEVRDSKMTNNNHKHTGAKEQVHFVVASKNLCIADPMYIEKNGKMIKISGAEANLDEVIAQFAKSEALNTRTDYPLEHFSMSLKKGENLPIHKAADMITEFMKRMGYGDCTWISTCHEDTDNIHYHIGLCNISNKPPHKSVQPANKYQLAAIIRSELEIKYGLEHDKTPFVDRDANWNPLLDKNTIKNAIRNGIREELDALQGNKINLPTFMQAMNKKGIGVFAQLRNEDRNVIGLSFSFRGQKVKASSLGAGCKTKEIMECVEYDRHQHFERVIELNEQESARTALYEQNEKAIDSKAEELSKAYYEDNEDLYIVTEATQKQISEMFGNNEPTVEAYQNNSTGNGLAAVRIQPLQNDAADVTQLEYVAGEDPSKLYVRADKDKAAKMKQENEKKKKKQQEELMKAIRALVAAFCRHESYFYREDPQHQPQPNSGLMKYGIDTTASVSVITKTQLLQLQAKIWNENNAKGIKGKRLLKDNNDGYAYLEKELKLTFSNMKKTCGANRNMHRTMDCDSEFPV